MELKWIILICVGGVAAWLGAAVGVAVLVGRVIDLAEHEGRRRR